MSRASFVEDLLATGQCVLNDESHFLNAAIQHLFERLTTQAISARSLRTYLRLGTSLREESSQTTVVPLNRVKCLISTVSVAKSFSDTAFVEFNMFSEGFGCIFLASIAPQLFAQSSIVGMGSIVGSGNDIAVNGGVGAGERIFPPQHGMSYSTWIFIEKFGSASPVTSDMDTKTLHPIRILSLLRHSKLKETLTSCLAIYMSPNKRTLYVSTEECLVQNQRFDNDDQPSTESIAKFSCSEFFQTQWQHLTFVFNRAVLKNSSVSLYVNGKHFATQKLHYLNILAASSTQAHLSNTSIHAVIGTLPLFRQQSPVVWRQASCHLFEDVLTASNIASLYQLGPNYLGSFQVTPNLASTDPQPLVPEERIVFGLHAHKSFDMTLNKFRKIYNKNDSKTIGKQLNIPSNESVTPLRILSNTATQLAGPSRTVGGVIIGYMGVSTFQPQPLYKTLEDIGGVHTLLGFIAMADSVEYMYASVKALVCVSKVNLALYRDLDRLNAYQLLAMLYKRKKHLINSHILNLTLSMVVADDSGREQAIISNPKAFESLICDLDIWYSASVDIQRSLHERLNDLLNEKSNAKHLVRINLLKRLLYLALQQLYNPTNQKNILTTVRILITDCLSATDQEPTSRNQLITFGQFLVSLLPSDSPTNDERLLNEMEPSSEVRKRLEHTIQLRNSLFTIIDDVFSVSPSTDKSVIFQEELNRLLGLDWFLVFMQPRVHPSTVIKASKCLFALLLNPVNLSRFKESQQFGGWLNHVVIGFSGVSAPGTPNTPASGGASVSSFDHTGPSRQNTLPSIGTPSIGDLQLAGSSFFSTSLSLAEMNVAGFQTIEMFFKENPDLIELYFLLFALLFDAQKMRPMTSSVQLDLNAICMYVFEKAFDSEQTLFGRVNSEVAVEVSIVLLSMVRTLMNDKCLRSLEANNYAIIILQSNL